MQPYIRTFDAAVPLSLMEFAGRLLNRFCALEVLRTLWALPTAAGSGACDRAAAKVVRIIYYAREERLVFSMQCLRYDTRSTARQTNNARRC